MAEGLHATITADTQQYETGMQRAIAATDKFTAASKQAASSSKSLSSALGMSGVRDVSAGLSNMSEAGRGVASSFKLAKGASSQFGYQIQDIAVQLQMGTNAAMVFAQQGSQIASMFGPGGAALGAVIAVAGAIGGPLLYALFDSTDAAKDLTSELDELTEGFHELSAAERAYIELSTARRIAEAREQIVQLREGVADANKQITALTAHEEFGWEKGVQTATESIIEQEAAIGRLEGKIKEFEKLGAIARGEIKGEDQLQEEKQAAEKAARDKKRRDKELADIAQFEYDKLGIRMSLFAQGSGFEIEAENEKNAIKLEQLQTALENEIITQAEYNALKESEEERHWQAVSGIRAAALGSLEGLVEASYGKQAAMMAKSLKGALSDMSTHSRGMFELHKTVSLGEAIISGYEAATSAWAHGMRIGGPPLAAAFTAASVAKTGAQIAAISSMSFGNKAGGQAAGGGGSPTASAAQAQSEPASVSENSIVNINLEGDRFDKKSVIGLIEQINEAVADGARINVR